MANQQTLTAGQFSRRSDLDNAVRVLRDAGIWSEDISKPVSNAWGGVWLLSRHNPRTLPGVLPGVGIGVGLGGLSGWIANVGTMPTSSFLTSDLFTGTFWTGLGGLIGGVVGALAGKAVPEREPDRYKRLLMTGGFLMSVTSEGPESTTKIRRLLQMCGAQQVATNSDISFSRPVAVTAKRIS